MFTQKSICFGVTHIDCILGREVRPPPALKRRCPGYDTKVHHVEVGILFIAIAPKSTLPGVVVPVRVPSMAEIDLFKNYLY